MIDCAIINDLTFVYVSGEASPQTQQLVEAHLPACPDCAKAIEQAKLADIALETWDVPKEKPENGRLFISRLQQLLFIVSTLVLMAFTFGWAVWHRFILLDILNAEGIHLQLPIRFVLQTTPLQIWLTVAALIVVGGWKWIQYRHPQATPEWVHQAKVILYALLGLFAYNLTGIGRMPGILLGGLFLLGLFVLALRWRMQQPAAEKWVEWVRSGITAVPLLGLILATVNTITSGQVPGIFIAPSLLFLGLAYTYRHLPRLPYLPSITLISLLLANGLLALRAVQAFAALLVNN
ncbi:MAG: zf-HC2 domain-containing protein [Chloroflexota bacterium]